MKNIKRSSIMVALLLTALSGCSSHCTCPPQPQTPASTTTIIHEPPSNSGY